MLFFYRAREAKEKKNKTPNQTNFNLMPVLMTQPRPLLGPAPSHSCQRRGLSETAVAASGGVLKRSDVVFMCSSRAVGEKNTTGGMNISAVSSFYFDRDSLVARCDTVLSCTTFLSYDVHVNVSSSRLMIFSFC